MELIGFWVFFVLLVALLVAVLVMNGRQQGTRRRAPASVPPGNPLTFVRTYRGSRQANAIQVFNAEAETFAKEGYTPTAQSWAPGQWSGGDFLGALLLCLLLVGILIFIYMIIVKPAGTLTVTYARAQPSAQPDARTGALQDLAQLGALRDSGVITQEEFDAKKAALLARI